MDIIKQIFADNEKLKPFAKRKIKEVEECSTHKVRSVWKAIKAIRAIKTSVSLDVDE